MRRREMLAGAGLALAAPGLIAPPARAEDWPGTRPVRIIHPTQAGSPSDVYTRMLCEHFGRVFGGTFVTENRTGGTGTIGIAHVAQSAPDGWTLLLASNTSHVVAPLVISNVPYDPVRSFEPIAALYRYGMMLIIAPTIPARTTQEFVDWAKARPNGVNLASVGLGSVGHLMAERFHLRAGFQRVHVPYRGGPAAILALSQGESDYIFDNLGNSGPMMREGRLRGLALTGRNRAPQMPEIPLLSEVGYPGFEEVVWFGLYGPTGMPRSILEKLNVETNRWLASEPIRRRMAENAHEQMIGSPDDMGGYWAVERRLWAEVVRETGVKAE